MTVRPLPDLSIDRSYGLVFIPSPCWVRGEKVMLNLHPENPHLEAGSVQRLLHQEELLGELARTGRSCTLVVHPEGHGTIGDLHMLQHELEELRFDVTVVGGA